MPDEPQDIFPLDPEPEADPEPAPAPAPAGTPDEVEVDVVVDIVEAPPEVAPDAEAEEAPPVEVRLDEDVAGVDLGDGAFLNVEGLYDANGDPVVPLDEHGRLELTAAGVSLPAKLARDIEGVPVVTVTVVE